MKKFFLLSLALMASFSLWADVTETRYAKNDDTGMRNDGTYVKAVALGGDASWSSNKLKIGSSKTGTFTVEIKSSYSATYTIKSIVFTYDGSGKPTSFTGNSIAVSSNTNWSAGSTTPTKVDFSLTTGGSEVKIMQMDITLTPKGAEDPTITFRNGAYALGGSALDLSTLFTSNSTGEVTYSIKTDGGTSAAIDGTSFTATAAGTCVVTASQAAVKDKYNAKSVDANIVVAGPTCPSGLTISGTTDYTGGQTISLEAVLEAGNGEITYNWYKGADLATAKAAGSIGTGASFSKANCVIDDEGNYFCVASKDDCGDAESDAYEVTVTAAPDATYVPQGLKTLTTGANETIYCTDITKAGDPAKDWVIVPSYGTSAQGYTKVATDDTDGNPDGITDILATTGGTNPNMIQIKADGNTYSSQKRAIHMRVKNITGFIAHGKATSTNRGMNVAWAEDNSSMGLTTFPTADVVTIERSTAGCYLVSKTGLDKTKEYVLSIYAQTNDNYFYAIELIAATIPTALDNTDASVKAVKVLRDGQIFIEKNGHVYNVLGGCVK